VEEVFAKLSLWGRVVVAIEVRLAGCRRERKGRCSHAATAGIDSMTLNCFAKQNLGRMLLLVAVKMIRPKLRDQCDANDGVLG
jgi:hypothetical protein